PTPISGTAVLEYGGPEILPRLARSCNTLRVSADLVAKPAAHSRAESRGFRPSTAAPGERRTLRWRKGDSNPWSLCRASHVGTRGHKGRPKKTVGPTVRAHDTSQR